MREIFFYLPSRKINDFSIVTLGPKGTSSERSANFFGELMLRENLVEKYSVTLSNSYEEASDLLLNGKKTAAIVANAYGNINRFYMNPHIDLYAAFLRNTPNYGIATLNKNSLSKNINIASHPAPIPLIDELLPKEYSVNKIELKESTSRAAVSASLAEVDAALTTEDAAKLHNLSFISKIRPIQMLWSVFVNLDSLSYSSSVEAGSHVASVEI